MLYRRAVSLFVLSTIPKQDLENIFKINLVSALVKEFKIYLFLKISKSKVSVSELAYLQNDQVHDKELLQLNNLWQEALGKLIWLGDGKKKCLDILS